MARCPECNAWVDVHLYGKISPTHCKECGAELELIGGDIKFKLVFIAVFGILSLFLLFLFQNEYVGLAIVLVVGIIYVVVVPKFRTVKKLSEVDDLLKDKPK